MRLSWKIIGLVLICFESYESKCYITKEQGSRITNRNTVSNQYFLDEILHSLINLIVIIRQQDFEIITKNTIAASVDNNICKMGGQGFSSEQILNSPFTNSTILLDLILYSVVIHLGNLSF